jgi:hypothetical protein
MNIKFICCFSAILHKPFVCRLFHNLDTNILIQASYSVISDGVSSCASHLSCTIKNLCNLCTQKFMSTTCDTWSMWMLYVRIQLYMLGWDCGNYGHIIVRENCVSIPFIMNLQPSFCTPLCCIIFPCSLNTFQSVLVTVNLMFRLLYILDQCYWTVLTETYKVAIFSIAFLPGLV